MYQQLLADAPQDTNHYSTFQIVETLNDLVCSAAEILFNHTDAFKAQIATLLAVFQTDHRKNLSNASLQVTQIAIFEALVKNDFTPLRTIYIDRSFLFSAVSAVCKDIIPIVKIEKALLRNYSNKRQNKYEQLRAELGITQSPLLLLTSVEAWLKLYLKFRNDIIKNYVRLAYNQAEAAKSNSDVFVDIEELWMNYILAINRAVDKCDLTKGTLTSYVQQWFLNAKTNADFSHEYAISYDLPSAQRAKNTKLNKWHLQSNFAPSLDDEKNLELSNKVEQLEDDNVQLHFDRFDFDENLLTKFRYIKKARLTFLTMKLPIMLTPAENNYSKIRQSNEKSFGKIKA